MNKFRTGIFLLLILSIGSLDLRAEASGIDSGVKSVGRLFDIGGYKLHLHRIGHGKSTVILIAGSSAFSFDWALVQGKLSHEAVVCSYDRPGLAWSDIGPMPRTFNQDVYELHELLRVAKVKPPYILVGHSIGGVIARKFAKQYSDEISGMVLVDATSENSLLNVNGKIERVRLLASAKKSVPEIKTHVDTVTKVPSREKIENFLKVAGTPSIYPPYDRLPVRLQKIRIWAQTLPKYYVADNGDYWPEEFSEMYSDSASYKLHDKPLFILTSIKNEYPESLGEERNRMMTDKIQNQRHFLQLSTNSEIVTTAHSGHEIHLSEPELIISAVKEVIGFIRDGTPLQ